MDDNVAQQAVLGASWFDGETATFGDRLAGARDAAGLSQEELAKRLGVKPKTVRGWENDQSEPRANKLQMVAGLLNVSLMWLLTGEGEGLDAPELAAEMDDTLTGLLTELRTLRREQSQIVERMGRLEKRLRLALADTGGAGYGGGHG